MANTLTAKEVRAMHKWVKAHNKMHPFLCKDGKYRHLAFVPGDEGYPGVTVYSEPVNSDGSKIDG